MPFEKTSWKYKIDPAFDKIIKQFIQFLDISGMPANSGWVVLEDEPLTLWQEKGMQGWIKRYEKNMTKEMRETINFLQYKNMPEHEINKKRNDYRKWLFTVIKILPEESQNYYKNVFEPFYSEKVACGYFNGMTREQRKTAITDLYVDIAVLTVHAGLIEFENEAKNSPETFRKKYIRPSIVVDILLSAYDAISRLVFEKGLPDLLKEAKRGNEDSFFKLLRIDRTVVECEWGQKMIRKAQLTGDEKFFRKMAKAITTSPLENAKVYGQAAVVLLLFWRLGLYRLTNDELIELLEYCGIKVQDDPESFRKFVNRLISPDLKKDIVTFHENQIPSK